MLKVLSPRRNLTNLISANSTESRVQIQRSVQNHQTETLYKPDLIRVQQVDYPQVTQSTNVGVIMNIGVTQDKNLFEHSSIEHAVGGVDHKEQRLSEAYSVCELYGNDPTEIRRSTTESKISKGDNELIRSEMYRNGSPVSNLFIESEREQSYNQVKIANEQELEEKQNQNLSGSSLLLINSRETARS
ncbi:MAG: hypothetical protein EZS28_054888, partial [Streblomastix strix]